MIYKTFLVAVWRLKMITIHKTIFLLKKCMGEKVIYLRINDCLRLMFTLISPEKVMHTSIEIVK